MFDRARGALLGGACGDAIGAPFAGAPAINGHELDEWCRTPRVLRYTDDTAQALALGDHVVWLPRGGQLREQGVAEELAHAWQQEPWRGYAPAMADTCRHLLAGAAWSDAATHTDQGGWYGNGAAMRVAPVALAEHRPAAVAAMARISARATHGGALAADGAVAQAVAVSIALHMCHTAPVDRATFLAGIAEHVESEEFRRRLAVVGELVHLADPVDAAGRLGDTATALASVPAALLAFLRHPDSVDEAIRFAVHIGGDTDTVAAMTGAIVGARNGLSAIPISWLARLENAPHLCALADDLIRRLDGFTNCDGSSSRPVKQLFDGAAAARFGPGGPDGGDR